MQQPTSTTTLATTRWTLAALAVAGSLLAVPAWAQVPPVTSGQKATADKVAQSGVPLSELAPDAPDQYTIKPGDTLWAISGLFLKSPWRWPELWGMNRDDIRNPHRIYPGQKLVLDRSNGRATLRTAGSADAQAAGAVPTVKVSPRTRFEALDSGALPMIRTQLIEPFLAEPLIVDEAGLQNAPRFVATQDGRVLITRGDRAYARGQTGTPLLDGPGKQREFRVFRSAVALRDPDSGAVLGYEAQYIGRAQLVRSESVQTIKDRDGKETTEIVPATLDVTHAKEEMRIGDRLVPEPERELLSYVPHAPQGPVDARIVSVYGSAVANAAQNQVVVINKGRQDGMERGHVLAIQKYGARMVDRTDAARAAMKLPDERNGLLLVFTTFERLSYGLVLDITDGVRVGDRLVNPR